MAATAEVIAAFPFEQQLYGKSQSTLYGLGAIGVRNTVAREHNPYYEMAKANTFSAVVEMLGTDKTSTEILDIDPEDIYPIIDGQACDKDGTPMREKVARGTRRSWQLAQEDPRFLDQYERDIADEYIADLADSLDDGQSHVTISMKPVEAMLKHPKLYKNELGYGDLVYIQRYTKSGDVMISAAHSILVKDITAFKKELAAKGFQIPDDESTNKWIMHGNTYQMDAEEAKTFVQSIREDYYKRVGQTGKRKSATEYVKSRRQTFDTLFNAYYPSLSEAVYTGSNNEVMQNLAQKMLGADLSRMKKEIKASLIQVAVSENFDSKMGDTMETLIRYAIVEQLRKGLQEKPSVPVFYSLSNAWSSNIPYANSSIPSDIHYTNQVMARSLSEGVQAGRGYGGCPGQVELTDGDLDWGSGGVYSANTAGGAQWGYGGRGRKNFGREEDEDCEFTSKKCPECKAENVKTKVTKTHISGSCGCKVTRK